MDCRIRLWDIATNKIKSEIDCGPGMPPRCLTLTVAAVTLTGPLVARRHSVETWTATFNPKHAHVASGSQSGNINLWDVETGSKLGCIETHGKFAMAVQYVSRPWPCSMHRQQARQPRQL